MTPPPGAVRLAAPSDHLARLATTDLLRHTSPGDVSAVARSAEWLSIEAGAPLFAVGDAADGIYLVVSGRLESHLGSTPIGEIGRGGTVGEIAVLAGTRRTASVRAVRDSVVVRIPPEELPVLAGRSPGIAVELARLTARRAATAPPVTVAAPPPRSIGVVALDGSDRATELAEAVAGRLSRTRTVRRIGSQDLRSYQAEGGIESVTSHLAAAEDGCDSVVISLTSAPEDDVDDLALGVLRQTDLVVGVAAADGEPDGRILSALERVRRPVSVALLRATGAAPAGTARWLEAVSRRTEVRSRIHLRAGSESDLDRLVRTVIGRATGVVLGGGGARGFAHIGVLRALREAGVAVDAVGGSSMGAVIGAQLAMGLTPDEMLEANTAAWTRRQLLDFVVPTLSLLRGRGATRTIDGFFGDARIEDLPLDYFCTTVDLSEFSLHVARRGSVAAWVRASTTVPGLWPPVVDADGHLHVDGGMLNNVPTDVMRGEQAGTVVGVDVCSRQSEMRVPASVRSLPGGLALVRARSGGQWYPSILDVLNRANLLASLRHQQTARLHADLFITPPVEDEGFAAFDRVAKLAGIGYRSAVAALERDGLPDTM